MNDGGNDCGCIIGRFAVWLVAECIFGVSLQPTAALVSMPSLMSWMQFAMIAPSEVMLHHRNRDRFGGGTTAMMLGSIKLFLTYEYVLSLRHCLL